MDFPISYPQPTFDGSLIKRLFIKGKLPRVKKGIYGGDLTKNNVTDEHIKPKSKGGTNAEDNIALATKQNNNDRGNEPLEEWLTQEELELYLQQFEGTKLPKYNFNGDAYVKGIRERVSKEIGEA